MITTAELRERTRKDLADLARDEGIAGWHGMRKDDLVRALMRAERAKQRARKAKGAARASKRASSAKSKRSKNGAANAAANGKSASANGRSRTTGRATKVAAGSNGATKARSNGKAKANGRAKAKPAQKEEGKRSSRATRRIQAANAERSRLKDLSSSCVGERKNGKRRASTATKGNGAKRDRVVLLVRDSYWLHACWDVSRQSVERIKAAMAEQWHTARPIIRLIQVEVGNTTSSAERVECEIDVHGGVNNWYIDVYDPPSSYRIDLGYLSDGGKFYSLARSNLVTTPPPGSSDALDENWSDVARDYERIYAQSGGYDKESGNGDLKDLFEERLRRPMGTPMVRQFAVSGGNGAGHNEFGLEVDAELIIYGQTHANARITLAGHPVKLRPDGSFTVRKSLPDRRQVLPVVSASGDGMEQRTIILAIERNTKVMEPLTREQYDPTQSH